MTEDQEEEKKILNNPELQINRGVELLLRNRRNKPPKKPPSVAILSKKLVASCAIVAEAFLVASLSSFSFTR